MWQWRVLMDPCTFQSLKERLQRGYKIHQLLHQIFASWTWNNWTSSSSKWIKYDVAPLLVVKVRCIPFMWKALGWVVLFLSPMLVVSGHCLRSLLANVWLDHQDSVPNCQRWSIGCAVMQTMTCMHATHGPNELGSWSRAVTSADSTWMTRGHHSKNATFNIRNYYNGASLPQASLSERQRWHNWRKALPSVPKAMPHALHSKRPRTKQWIWILPFSGKMPTSLVR